MSSILLLRNRSVPASMIKPKGMAAIPSKTTDNYLIWDISGVDQGPIAQSKQVNTVGNQLAFLMRKTWNTPVPVGTVVQYVGVVAPTGWFFCDGSSYSKTSYSDLFGVIGNAYGIDGSNKFRVPNMKRNVPVGYDASDSSFNALGKTGGERTHTLTISEMPEHNHNVSVYNDDFNANSLRLGNGPSFAANYDSDPASGPQTKNTFGSVGQYNIINNTGGGQDHNNMQPYVVVQYIIKW
jgi:microcystin-dependent protein